MTTALVARGPIVSDQVGSEAASAPYSENAWLPGVYRTSRACPSCRTANLARRYWSAHDSDSVGEIGSLVTKAMDNVCGSPVRLRSTYLHSAFGIVSVQASAPVASWITTVSETSWMAMLFTGTIVPASKPTSAPFAPAARGAASRSNAAIAVRRGAQRRGNR